MRKTSFVPLCLTLLALAACAPQYSTKLHDDNNTAAGETPPPDNARSCPANYEFVEGNSKLGTYNFCLAKYEMKKDSNGKAISAPEGKPWLANKTTAQNACAELGTNHRLPKNAEWTTVALEIYNQDENWTGNKTQQGVLYTGLFARLTEPVGITNTNNPYDGSGQSSGVQRRVSYLANGKTLWDIAGNAWEWVSDTIYGSSYTPALTSFFPRLYHTTDVQPGSPQLFDFTGLQKAPPRNVNMGILTGGKSGKVVRGGSTAMADEGATGIFAASLGDISTNELQAPSSWGLQINNIGFRCVTRPE